MELIRFQQSEISCQQEGGQVFVAIKPICDAIGINYQGQNKLIQEDEILGQLSYLTTTVGADGRNREMLCLPLEYLNGWLFGVNTNRVKSEVRSVLVAYKRDCYKALFAHFYGHLIQKEQDVS